MSTGVRREVLLNPGPVNVSDRVRLALGRGDLCHREPEFSRLMANVRRMLEELFAPTHAAVLVAGSGTCAVEAMIASLAPRGKKLAVVTNGVYGERILEIARRHGLETVAIAPELTVAAPPPGVSASWLGIPALESVERVLADPSVGALAGVHHETTTGLLNPVAQWGALARRHGKPFLLDSVSGMAGEPLELEAWGVTAVACTANKCIQGIPGSSFVLVARSQLAAARSSAPSSLYLDLFKNLEAQEKGYPAFTQPVQVLFAFEAALEELRDETVAGRVGRMKRASRLLREGFSELGLELLLPEAVRSNTITTLALPRGVSYPALHDALKARGFVIYAGQGGLERSVFRVANMGALAEHDFRSFLAALAESVRTREGARA